MKSEDKATVWSVRRRGGREAGTALFGSDRNARQHVELNSTGRTEWSFPAETKMVASDERGTWVIIKKQIQDTAAIILDNTATRTP